ncbi:hypothetical protein VTN00DRAFT_6513 [Thermoascus crustaceus]|uniref:uncharacterized protein n=1 Tax=Thermoascus crustaceus TaxID=5088 RepID=UPI003743FFE1
MAKIPGGRARRESTGGAEAAVRCKARRRGRWALLDHSACETPAGQQAATRQELPAIPPMTARRGARTAPVRTRDRRAEVSPAHLAPARYLGTRSGTFPRPVTAPAPYRRYIPFVTVTSPYQPSRPPARAARAPRYGILLEPFIPTGRRHTGFTVSACRDTPPSTLLNAPPPHVVSSGHTPGRHAGSGMLATLPSCFMTPYPEGMCYPGFLDGD